MILDTDLYELIRAFSSKISRQMQVNWDDLTQQSVVKVLAFKGGEFHNFKGWMWRVIRNEAVSMIRAEGRDYPAGHLNDDAIALGLNIDISSIEQGYASAENRIRIEAALDSMSEIERHVVILRADGFSVNETAQRLNLSSDMVKKHHYRVRTRLRTSDLV